MSLEPEGRVRRSTRLQPAEPDPGPAESAPDWLRAAWSSVVWLPPGKQSVWCGVPSCSHTAELGGLCRRHYMQARYKWSGKDVRRRRAEG